MHPIPLDRKSPPVTPPCPFYKNRGVQVCFAILSAVSAIALEVLRQREGVVASTKAPLKFIGSLACGLISAALFALPTSFLDPTYRSRRREAALAEIERDKLYLTPTKLIANPKFASLVQEGILSVNDYPTILYNEILKEGYLALTCTDDLAQFLNKREQAATLRIALGDLFLHQLKQQPDKFPPLKELMNSNWVNALGLTQEALELQRNNGDQSKPEAPAPTDSAKATQDPVKDPAKPDPIPSLLPTHLVEAVKAKKLTVELFEELKTHLTDYVVLRNLVEKYGKEFEEGLHRNWAPHFALTFVIKHANYYFSMDQSLKPSIEVEERHLPRAAHEKIANRAKCKDIAEFIKDFERMKTAYSLNNILVSLKTSNKGKP